MRRSSGAARLMKRLLAIGGVLIAGAGLMVFGVAAGDSGSYRVRAIFDSANQVTVGEEARVAGVTVGVIEQLEVTDDNKAAVTLRIDNPGYQDFRTDAHCVIRPQSLIGEQYIDCSPTRPVPPGGKPAPTLSTIASGAGQGDHLLPVENTSSPVGIDLINNIMRVPQRQRLAVILNEFGVALAGNGQTLNTVIRRANPALQETDKVLQILADQNTTLANLAEKSDKSLAPLARERASVAGFVRNSEVVSRASAAKGAALQQNFEKFPAFLEQLTPTMNQLSAFSSAFGGALEPLQGNTAAINSAVAHLPALANYSIDAFKTLGSPVATTGSTVLTNPAVLTALSNTKTMAAGLNPFATGLGGLLESVQKTGGWEYLMQTLYFQTGVGNGFNASGHYVRGELLVYPIAACATTEVGRGSTYGACSANFDHGEEPTVSAAAAMVSRIARAGGSVISRPFGWQNWSRPQKAVRVAQPRAKAPSASDPQSEGIPPATTTPTTKPQAPVDPNTEANGAMLKYLLGGGKR